MSDLKRRRDSRSLSRERGDEEGEVNSDEDRRGRERKHSKKDKKKKHKKRSRSRSRSRDRAEDRERRERERDREPDRFRDRDRREKDHRRDDQRRGNDKGRNKRVTSENRDSRDSRNGRDRDDRNGKSNNDDRGQHHAKKTPQEIAAEKKAEEEYRKRVEEQMRSMEDMDDSSEDEEAKAACEAEERKKRRAELLAKFQKERPKTPPLETDSIQTMSKLKNIQSEDDIRALRRRIQLEEDEATLKAAEETKEEEEFGDMFQDDVSQLVVRKNATTAHGEDASSLDTDDHEGYYRFRLGDMLNNRYRVVANQGRGVFSSVVRVRDTVFGDRELVIKLIRNNDTMHKAGQKELELLRIIAANDMDNKKHCIKLCGDFEHHNHLCLVFEPMAMNLREVVKKLGGKGLNIRAVRSFAKQLFTALKHVKKCEIVHGDIKPDNILVNDNMNVVKLCDFGSAGRTNECEITPYLVSRFYRAPEIMVGLSYAEPIDVWSMCCVLYELYTGTILFPGKDNNDMLRLMLEVKGNFPNRKILRNAAFADRHFEKNGDFIAQRVDKITKSILTEVCRFDKPTRNLHDMLKKYATQGMSEADRIKVSQLADFLEKGFQLDPQRRMTVDDALVHPFIYEKEKNDGA